MEENIRFIELLDTLINNGQVSNYVTISSQLGTNKAGINDIKTGRKKLPLDVIQKTKALFPQVNIDWLITGAGSMFIGQDDGMKKSYRKRMPVASPIATPQDGIPLVTATAIGGFGNFEFSIQATDVKGMYVVPKFQDKKIDFMIEVTGSSMYPKYNSGDVVACRIIRESQFIQWNKVHVVATREQGILVKRLKPSQKKGYILAVSDNKSYDPFEIPLSEIEGLALVVGVIRLE